MQMPAFARLEALLRIGRSGLVNAWLVGANLQFAATSTGAADADAVAGVQHAAGVDSATATDHQVARVLGPLDLDEAVDHHAWSSMTMWLPAMQVLDVREVDARAGGDGRRRTGPRKVDPCVMAGLGPATHDFLQLPPAKSWVDGLRRP